MECRSVHNEALEEGKSWGEVKKLQEIGSDGNVLLTHYVPKGDNRRWWWWFKCKQISIQKEIHKPRQLSVMSDNLTRDMVWHYIPEQLCAGTGFNGPHMLMWYCTPVDEGFVTQLPLLFLRDDRSMRPPLRSNTCDIRFVFSVHTGWCQHTPEHTRAARQLTMHSWGHILHANGVSSSNE